MAKKMEQYAVTKDGCWLADYRDTGIREFIGNALTSVPTGVYTSDARCARLFDNYAAAESVARTLGARVTIIREEKNHVDR